MATVTELVTEFSYKGSTEPLRAFNMGLGEAIGLLAGVGAAMVAAASATAVWANDILAAEQTLINLSSETGVAVERLQELAYAANVSNSSTEALNSSMSGLAAKIGEAAQKGSEDFSRLGISVRDAAGRVKSSDQVFKEIGARFRQLNLSLAEQRSFLDAFGIDASLVTLLNRTSGEMAELSARARELGVLTNEQVDQAMNYNDAVTTMGFAMDGLKRITAVGLSPVLMELAETFTDLLTENREWIVNGLQATFKFVADVLAALKRLAPVLAGLGGAFVAAKIAALGFAGVMGVILSPVVVWTAAITTALVIIDDLIVAMNGGKSAIRDFFLEFVGVDIVPILQEIVDGFKRTIAVIGELFSGLGSLIVGDFEGAFSKMANAFMMLFEPVLNWFRDALLGLLPDWALKLIEGDQSPQQAQQMAFGGVSSVTNNGANISQNVQISVSTNNPERAAQSIANNLQRQMGDAQTQSRRGGM